MVEKSMVGCIIQFMKLINFNRLRLAVLTLLTVGISTGHLFAAKKQEAPVLEGEVPTWAIMVTVVFFVGICVVAFKNARRSHLVD